MQNQPQYTQNLVQQPHPGNLQQQPQSYGDLIDQLPSDQTVPSHNEIQIVDTLFKQKSTVDTILVHVKDILIIGLLFVIFSLPQIDNLLQRFITVTQKSPYILIGIKALLFMAVYFLLKNLYLARNS